MKNVSLAMAIIALTAAAASAAPTPPQPDDACREWFLRDAVTGNWVNAPKEREWVCIDGRDEGRTTNNRSASVGGGAFDPSNPSDPTPTYGKGNNGKGTPNGGKTDGGDPPGGGNVGTDGDG